MNENIKNIFYIGNKIIYSNEPYIIEFVDFIHPGKGRSFIRTKIKNLINDKLINKNFKYNNNIKKANIYIDNYNYLYNYKDIWYFININNLSQININNNIIIKNKSFICINNIYKIIFWNNKPIKIIIPKYINIKVIKTSFILNRNNNTNNKIAYLSTGLIIKVPLFINKGNLIKINTVLNSYILRI